VDAATAAQMAPRGGGAASPEAADDAPLAALYPTLCECGFRSQCKRLCACAEFLENDRVEPAAEILHRFARWVVARQRVRAMQQALAYCRHFAAGASWRGETLVGAVWRKARERGAASFTGVEGLFYCSARAEGRPLASPRAEGRLLASARAEGWCRSPRRAPRDTRSRSRLECLAGTRRPRRPAWSSRAWRPRTRKASRPVDI